MSLWGLLLEPQIYNWCFSLQLLIFWIIIIIQKISPAHPLWVCAGLVILLLFWITPFLLSLSSNISKVSRLKGIYRIGPHNIDILSIIFGSLLGDAHGEKRLLGGGTRITFFQEDSHINYILFLHKMFSDLGYCNPKIPSITTRLGNKGKVRKIVRFSTWTFTSFNWIHDLWYKNQIKCVPECIGKYLTPLALAIWIMDDGSKVGKGLKFSTNSYTYNDCIILVKALHDNFNLKASIQLAGAKDQYIIYIWKESMEDLRKIVGPYIIPAKKYLIVSDDKSKSHIPSSTPNLFKFSCRKYSTYVNKS